jgi:hypothetical protein
MPMPTDAELAAWVVVSSIIERLALPDKLCGCTVTVPEFTDAETCAHFYEGRTLGFHQTINALLAREVCSRGCDVVKILMTRSGGQNQTEETRRASADRRYSVVGEQSFDSAPK